MSKIIYLAGSVPKGNEEAKFDNWRIEYKEVLKKHFQAEFIDPYDHHSYVDENDSLLVFGIDSNHIKTSDFIVVNAESKLGAGTSMEMVVAKYFKKPVVTVLPKDTYHRRSNLIFGPNHVKDWVHPFIHSFSDFIIENIVEIEKIKDKIFSSKIKTISVIDDAIKYFESSQIRNK